MGTDFAQWSEAEIRAFLDQRGEDYDDCPDLDALVGAGTGWGWLLGRAGSVWWRALRGCCVVAAIHKPRAPLGNMAAAAQQPCACFFWLHADAAATAN